MQLLLAAGAKPDFIAQDGTTLVLAAAQGSSAAALELALATMPAQVNLANAHGATPFHMLIGSGPQPELGPMMRILAAHGGRSDIKGKGKRATTAAEMALTGLSSVRAVFLATFPDHAKIALAAKPQ